MDKDYFLNSCIPPPTLQLEHTMSTWSSLSSGQELNRSSGQLLDCFMKLNWDKSTDQYSNHFGSALSSMVSYPVATNSAASNDSFTLLELIGNSSTSSSCFTTPLNSPPKLNMPMVDQIMNESFCSMRNSVALSPALPAIPVDPGFAERAAKFSCFGSRSFNGRTSQFDLRLPRASSSPALKEAGSPVGYKNSSQPQMECRANNGFVSGSDKNLSKLSGSAGNSNEESYVSEQVPSELNSRKRKAEAPKDAEAEDNANAKRSKPSEGTGSENSGCKKEEEGKSNAGDESKKQEKANQKPPEPPKDYIHVRARRGQATDSHSLAERVRREKISERMKLLQDLVPGCNKVTGKALMLDEIINYVQALQRQVEFLSMKLASVNPGLDFDMENFMPKDMSQPNAPVPPPICSLDSSAATLYCHQPQQTPQLHTTTSAVSARQCPVDPLDVTAFGEGLTQLPALCEDELQTIVCMGFNQNPNQDLAFHSQGFPVTSQTPHMKVEL